MDGVDVLGVNRPAAHATFLVGYRQQLGDPDNRDGALVLCG
jgi:hypothetical protein